MSDYKRFKDPIYGYVSIEKHLVTNIIDTAAFQRLRAIRQTSYDPLYAAALHNRFVHSIGVYYLGTIAAESMEKSLSENPLSQGNNKKIVDIFKLACLLHDVGHSPFSHSGEEFYLSEDINEKLKLLVNDTVFSKDADKYENDKKPANPHEIMSAIISIEQYGEIIGNENLSFFSRCITGYKYFATSNEEQIKNCFISMLNSNVIDVDKLDYLLRDAYVTGYDNVNIDYVRLLSSVLILNENDENYKLAFHKNALSVIENVVYARDAEKKWIQNHPTVLYDIYLIQHIIEVICSRFKNDTSNTVFCHDALTEEGIHLINQEEYKRFVEGLKLLKNSDEDGQENFVKLIDGMLNNYFCEHISLLSDGDVLFLGKQIENDELICEYFSRCQRRHPVWKSEAEFRSLFRRTLGDELLDKLELDIDALQSFINGFKMPVINQKALDEQNKKIDELENDETIDKKALEDTINAIKGNLKWIELFKNYCEEKQPDIEFDFVVITAKEFKSGFFLEDLGDILVYFPEFKKVNYLKHVTPLFELSKSRDNYFYIYYRRNECKNNYNCKTCSTKCGIDVPQFTKYIRDHIESNPQTN